MPNLALESNGASISLSTAWDKDHIPDMAIDGQDSTFWTTTGLFPHELIISFATPVSMQGMTVHGCGLRRVAVERSENEDPVAFEKIYEAELDYHGGKLQQETLQIQQNTICRHIKLVLKNGYTDFCAIYKIAVQGDHVAL
eukprot:Nk52_evm38s147 gene=Nk52_evmTU38s147